MARDSAIRYSSAGSGEDAVKKAETSASATTDDTDDTISINSTPYASDDSQAEYSVEDILAQDDDIDGVMKYLVQWTGYPLEKCTWEPAENMGPDLLRDLWDKKRKKKSYQPFDLSLYYGAVARKKDRHLRRNLRRKKRGLPQTYPFLDEDVPATFCKPTTEAADVADGEAAGLGQETETLKTESTMAKTASTQFIDITQDSDDDAVAIEGLSTPAVARTKKKKKKKKNQDTAPRKGKEKEAPKSFPDALKRHRWTCTSFARKERPGTSRGRDQFTAEAALGQDHECVKQSRAECDK
ncbi:hypothetical protein SBRCBS47491_003815 [Sporothrix bragantina]|uniref:Chromo domain-containing protein n=1 Tax=Sporothrix bragantina TaxID=671064 RepID=A0ABP0BIG0_9PEZI